ncbi:response regulator transcription factor [Phaeovibrio sulfidiphilus]|uniref:Response regulator transcription factor n=1 Tax=Phaeovibrio sulfidiphilus TaxID=1220600 RepID=A0A8J6YQP2_9PROT|nr:response regulator transcription factor [Phaeovibrio sulfidiphilus]MBE1237582.1 response regulator transcription factor [Phaeovibrio sulfidiphilus]
MTDSPLPPPPPREDTAPERAEPPEPRPHVLVIDDDERILSLIGRYLKEHDFLVSTAPDAATARVHLSLFRFDLLIVDIMMPGEDGLSLTRFVREGSDVPILMLTAMGQAEDRIQGFEAGADDYLPKPFHPRELLLRIASILRRTRDPARTGAEAGADDDPSVLRLGECRFDVEKGVLENDSGPVHLTTAELALLRVLAETPGAIVSREDLATRTGAEGGPRAIDVQVTRLRKKLEGDSRTPRYLRTVRGRGYQLVTD